MKDGEYTLEENDLKIHEFVKNLRSQADEFQEIALNNKGNIEVKFVSMMYAYREIASNIEQELLGI